jgi:hypothetical protein
VAYASTGGYNRWPSAGRAAGYNIAFKNNWFKNIWGGITMMGYYNYNVGPSAGQCRGQEPQGKYNLTGNLFQFTKGIHSSGWCIYINTNTDEQPWSSGNRLPITDMIMSHNTCYTPFTTSGGKSAIFLGQTGSNDYSWQNPTSGFAGQRVFEGNIVGRFDSGIFTANNNNGSAYRTDSRFFDKWFPGTLRADPGVWRKNILLGAAQQSAGSLAFPAGSVWTGCPNSSACVNSTTPPDYTKVFDNPGVDFRVKNDHPFKRSLDGADPGADPNQLPMIKGLTVQATDRSVLFTWSLTPVIAHIPCVVELHTSPDLESTSYAGNPTGYAAELSNISTYYGQDSDNTDRSYRDGNRRMLLLGHSIPLAANTAYFYRLHCGGDVAVGSFQTAAALSGTGTQTIIHTAQRSATANMLVEYGTLYSRATDTISGGGTASATCVDGRCVVNFTATKGSMYYYRWKERAANNSVLLSGRVEVMPAF